MWEIYINKASELFDFKEYLFSRNTLVCYEDMYVNVNVSHRNSANDGTYSFYGHIIYASGGIFRKNPLQKLVALNHSFCENQGSINRCIGRILHREGLFAEASKEGLFLGNGRGISTSGLWISYHTNRYNYSTDAEFKKLMIEEAFIVKKSLGAYYAMALNI
jgi:hypothetical protein